MTVEKDLQKCQNIKGIKEAWPVKRTSKEFRLCHNLWLIIYCKIPMMYEPIWAKSENVSPMTNLRSISDSEFQSLTEWFHFRWFNILWNSNLIISIMVYFQPSKIKHVCFLTEFIPFIFALWLFIARGQVNGPSDRSRYDSYFMNHKSLVPYWDGLNVNGHGHRNMGGR